jgi:hypothetical protein
MNKKPLEFNKFAVSTSEKANIKEFDKDSFVDVKKERYESLVNLPELTLSFPNRYD